MNTFSLSNNVEKNPVTASQILSYYKNKKISNANALNSFVEYALIHCKDNEFWLQDINVIANELFALWQFIQVRHSKKIIVKAFNPSKEQYDFEENFTCILISQEDAPFLVDSIQIALNELNLETHNLLSIGGFAVLRDNAGDLRDAATEDRDEPNWLLEDPVIIQINKQFDEEQLTKIETYLTKVLQEVHQAYEDNSLMREKCQWIIDELEAHRRHIPSDDTREAITFLKWLLDDHFVFLGYREYRLNKKTSGDEIELITGSGFGLLRDESRAVKARPIASLPEEAQRIASSNQILAITKTNTKSRVHRPSYTDYVGIKHYDDNGNLVGEHRFIGLFSHSAYNESVKNIPYLRQKVNAVMALAKVAATSYIGKKIMNIVENIPRDDMFQMSSDEIFTLTESILRIYERPVVRLFIRKDAYRRFYSCLIYIPKEKISANLYQQFSDLLLKELHGSEISTRVLLTDSTQGRLHYVVRIPNDSRGLQEPNFDELEQKIVNISKSWLERLKDHLEIHFGEVKAAELFKRYQHAFGNAYQEDYAPDEVLYDIQNIEEISAEKPISSKLFQLPHQINSNSLYLKFYQLNQLTTLSEIIPVLENMGLEVIEENPYECALTNKTVWISVYSIKIRNIENPNLETIRTLFDDLFNAFWNKKIDNDRLNALTLKCETPWHLVNVLRAYCSYYKQIGVYSQAYLEEALINQFHITKQLMQLFALRFDPHQNHDSEVIALKAEIQKNLTKVSNLDEDKIIRIFLALIDATLRTNYYQLNSNGERKDYLSFKFLSNKIPNLPLPHPCFEIFVHSTSFEAVHLRGSKVARGGLRWSDRREDFRTEVLGLMKAQQVKNTVIVPGGSKGGFILKANTSMMDRVQLQQEAISCYQNFMRGLLDLTDNYVDDKVVHPNNVRRFDEDDPYLVVAADKGTATFSDYANAISQEYGFWLGDAFASGGSNGYDHKKVGITARGAWISVEAHFKTLGIDPSRQEFTTIGLGDMSGDVFGNGMLRSRKTKLVAAFNHIHIFIDPNPNPETSFEERLRLFNLPGSTWRDYNPELISEGGGVFDRKAKSITLTPQIKALLEINEDEIEPSKLIQAILTANVDLLFNGGIGTYVKASSERNVDVGDKANDSVRVNASQLRCKVVGEGGNLGFTQLARVEYAEKGGLIFTDFIDNSAGVDLSDHEVNIKILLTQAIQEQQLNLNERNVLLRSMENSVADLVLKDNKDQTETLLFANAQSANELEVYIRLIQQFASEGKLDPVVEFLPSDRTIEERQKAGKGLTAPEIAVVMAYVKMQIKSAILKSDIPDDNYFQNLIENEFPEVLCKTYPKLLQQHRLRREIISTQLTNHLLSEIGILFIHRLQEETSMSIPQIIKAYAIVRKVFDIPKMFKQILDLDFKVAHSIQAHMMHRLLRFARRATRWLLRHNTMNYPIQEVIDQWHLIPMTLLRMENTLCGVAKEKFNQLYTYYMEHAVPEDMAKQLATIRVCYALLDINAISMQLNRDSIMVAESYFALGAQLGLDWLREAITNQAVTNHWEALAHSSLRDELDRLQAKMVSVLLSSSRSEDDAISHLNNWLAQYQPQLDKWHHILQQLQRAPKLEYVMYSVSLNMLSNVVVEITS